MENVENPKYTIVDGYTPTSPCCKPVENSVDNMFKTQTLWKLQMFSPLFSTTTCGKDVFKNHQYYFRPLFMWKTCWKYRSFIFSGPVFPQVHLDNIFSIYRYLYNRRHQFPTPCGKRFLKKSICGNSVENSPRLHFINRR